MSFICPLSVFPKKKIHWICLCSYIIINAHNIELGHKNPEYTIDSRLGDRKGHREWNDGSMLCCFQWWGSSCECQRTNPSRDRIRYKWIKAVGTRPTALYKATVAELDIIAPICNSHLGAKIRTFSETTKELEEIFIFTALTYNHKNPRISRPREITFNQLFIKQTWMFFFILHLV